MAASGIAEHNEARRREGVLLRQAFRLKEAKRVRDGECDPPSGEGPSTYDQQIYTQSRQGAMKNHDAAAIDRQRRLDHYNQMQQDYSAKIKNRYTSLDYASQW